MGKAVFLFDLDGVIFDTEGQYTDFWDGIGREYLGDPDLAAKLKGETIASSLLRCFPDDAVKREEVREKLYGFEAGMTFEYVPGAYEFLVYLKKYGYDTAVVTSSNRDKMAKVYKSRPEIQTLVTRIFTGEEFARSKPDPDCYLLGMEFFGASPDDTYIFEDSFNGLNAARASGGHVIALATTNARESVAPYADSVMDDFSNVAEDLGRTFGLILKKQ